MKIVERSDVFVTNLLPDSRRRLGIDVEDIRAVNPTSSMRVVRRWEPKGNEAGKGVRLSAFWARQGARMELLRRASHALEDALRSVSAIASVAYPRGGHRGGTVWACAIQTAFGR